MCLLVSVTNQDGIFVLTIATVVGLVLETGLVGMGTQEAGFRPDAPVVWDNPGVLNRRFVNIYRPWRPPFSWAARRLWLSPWPQCSDLVAFRSAYGSKAATLLLGIGSVVVSTAVLPHFSRMIAVRDFIGVRHTLKTYAQIILLLTVPLTAILMYYSEPMVRLFLQRGAFTEADTYLVGQFQAIYLLQVPLYMLGILCVRLISSFKASHLLLWGTIINLILSIILNYLFALWFQVAGIALATSLMYLISMIYLLCSAKRLINKSRAIS